MGKPKDNPAEELWEELTRTELSAKTKTKTQSSPNLEFKNLLRANDKRRQTRTPAAGFINVYDTDGKGLTRAILRNISPGGMGLETHPVKLTKGQKVIIEMSGLSTDFGQHECTVAWMGEIENHPRNHKILGLQFSNPSENLRAKLEKYFREMSALKGKRPPKASGE